MARGKLEYQCQLFGRKMIVGKKRTFELGDFNVMAEEQPASLDNGGEAKKESAGQALHKGFGRECALIEGREL